MHHFKTRRGLEPPLQCYGHLCVLGIPIPKILVIWAFPSRITLAIWVRVMFRVTGDAQISSAQFLFPFIILYALRVTNINLLPTVSIPNPEIWL